MDSSRQQHVFPANELLSSQGRVPAGGLRKLPHAPDWLREKCKYVVVLTTIVGQKQAYFYQFWARFYAIGLFQS